MVVASCAAWSSLQIMDKIVSFDCERIFPKGFPALAKDFVSRLMDVNPETRLGGGGRGLAEVKVCVVCRWSTQLWCCAVTDCVVRVVS